MTGALGCLAGPAVSVSRRSRRPSTNEGEIAARLLKALQSSDLSPAEAYRIVRRIATGKSTFYSRWNRIALQPAAAPEYEDDDAA